MKHGFHKPFAILKELVDKGKLNVCQRPAPPEDHDPVEIRPAEKVSDDELFEMAMRDVTPLGWSKSPTASPPPMRIENTKDTETEALRLLEEFVQDQGDVDPAHTGEYVEKHVQPIGLWLLRDLRTGRFSVQTQLDLHGLNRQEARDTLERFIIDSVRNGLGCVRIIHGRGRHSKHLPVLKERVQTWLSTRRMSRYVIAFTSARLCDGGAGALYVLLRRTQ